MATEKEERESVKLAADLIRSRFPIGTEIDNEAADNRFDDLLSHYTRNVVNWDNKLKGGMQVLVMGLLLEVVRATGEDAEQVLDRVVAEYGPQE